MTPTFTLLSVYVFMIAGLVAHLTGGDDMFALYNASYQASVGWSE